MPSRNINCIFTTLQKLTAIHVSRLKYPLNEKKYIFIYFIYIFYLFYFYTFAKVIYA